MIELEYRGDRRRPAHASQDLWSLRPDLYDPAPPLVKAVNVALLLGRPLLLTGESGTGKTELAWAIAWELGLAEPLRFDTRSTSEAKNLFYSFDALARLQESQAKGGAVEASPYVDLVALGAAIVRSLSKDVAEATLGGDLARRCRSTHDQCVRSIVIVDEIDKAPRDFPNDLLGALDRMAFRIPEARIPRSQDEVIRADDAFRPIVIATSNNENALPEPFLRRCIYHDVQFPDADRLKSIVSARAGAWVQRLLKRRPGGRQLDEKLVDAALGLFDELRRAQLRKKPATAELIEWVMALHARPDVVDGVVPVAAMNETLGVVVKRKEDLEPARRALERRLGAGPKAE